MGGAEWKGSLVLCPCPEYQWHDPDPILASNQATHHKWGLGLGSSGAAAQSSGTSIIDTLEKFPWCKGTDLRYATG